MAPVKRAQEPIRRDSHWTNLGIFEHQDNDGVDYKLLNEIKVCELMHIKIQVNK